MPYAHPEALVSTDWLHQHLNAPDIRIVDGSWYLPQMGRDAQIEYELRHIPGAVFFDLDSICDSPNGLPHMLPSPEKFSSRVRKLGLGDGNRIVVYDGSGTNMSAARVWWMLRAFGHEDVALLDGGLPKWMAEGRPVDDHPPMVRERHFTARLNSMLLRDLDQLRNDLESRHEQIVDARSPGRFRGAEPEPRPGLRGGHMPGAINLPYTKLVDPKAGTVLPPEQLARVIAEAGIDLDKPVVTTCGSGVSCCAVAFALHLAGHRQVAVYDGSWAEWGGRPDTPVESG